MAPSVHNAVTLFHSLSLSFSFIFSLFHFLSGCEMFTQSSKRLVCDLHDSGVEKELSGGGSFAPVDALPTECHASSIQHTERFSIFLKG